MPASFMSTRQNLRLPTAPAHWASLLTTNFWDYVLPLLFGTIWAAFLALLVAVPLSLGIALFITHYAPSRLAQTLGYLVDLLAAVPSVVYGLWGIYVVIPALRPIADWLNASFGFIPLFSTSLSGPGMAPAVVVPATTIATCDTGPAR